MVLTNIHWAGPTRKVREQPGGGSSQIQSLFGEDAEDEDENVNTTSAKPSGPPSTIKAVAQSTSEVEDISPPAQASQQQQSTFRPTRKVREL